MCSALKLLSVDRGASVLLAHGILLTARSKNSDSGVLSRKLLLLFRPNKIVNCQIFETDDFRHSLRPLFVLAVASSWLEAEPGPVAVRRLSPDITRHAAMAGDKQPGRVTLSIRASPIREYNWVVWWSHPACDVTNSVKVKHGTQEADKPSGCSRGGVGNYWGPIGNYHWYGHWTLYVWLLNFFVQACG